MGVGVGAGGVSMEEIIEFMSASKASKSARSFSLAPARDPLAVEDAGLLIVGLGVPGEDGASGLLAGKGGSRG